MRKKSGESKMPVSTYELRQSTKRKLESANKNNE